MDMMRINVTLIIQVMDCMNNMSSMKKFVKRSTFTPQITLVYSQPKIKKFSILPFFPGTTFTTHNTLENGTHVIGESAYDIDPERFQTKLDVRLHIKMQFKKYGL